MLLQGKNAVVTGANRGIGKSILTKFAEYGANVWACTRRPDDGFTEFVGQLEADTGVDVDQVHFDLADDEQVAAGAKQILAAKKPIDVLVNNAGIIDTSLFLMTPIDKMKELFEINFFSQLALTQRLARTMARQKSGSIVNLSSSAAIEGNEGRTGYASSKAALITATKVMARELGAANVRVNALAPGLTRTDMMLGSTPDDAQAQVVDRLSLKRIAEPDEIAGVVVFLASDLSSYLTGQVLSVDGGM